MILNAEILGTEVSESTFYDQVTGAPRLGFTVNVTALDADTNEKYELQLSNGFTRLDEIKDLRRQGAADDALRQVADMLRNELVDQMPRMSRTAFEVLKFKGKSASYIKLVCRFAQVAASAAV